MNYNFDPEHTFFTSDTHFNHANIIRLCDRPFKNIEQMNETLIANWNQVIRPDDTIFHLGDFCLGGSAEWTKVWQLFGHVHSRKNNTGIDGGRLQYLYPTQYDVGVDNNNFTPVSFCQVKQIINKQMEDHYKMEKSRTL